MADEKTILTYKGRPLMRKDNLVYYGSMADSHIVMLQILETKKVGEADVASKVSVELQLTDPNVRARDRIVKKSEKDGFERLSFPAHTGRYGTGSGTKPYSTLFFKTA